MSTTQDTNSTFGEQRSGGDKRIFTHRILLVSFVCAASAAGVFVAIVLALAIFVGGFVMLPLGTTNDAMQRLLVALESEDWDAASRAVSTGANVNLEIAGRPLLFQAIRQENLAKVRFLLDNGADVGVRTALGRSVLHEAALYGFHEIAKLLIERGADVNARNPRGETPLFYAEDGLLAGPPRTAAHREVGALIRQHGGVK
jgi:ankyrin repeat protein